MAEYPALPLFTDAFIADTMHLTTAQVGAYLLILMTAWRSSDCAVPDDDVYLARICRMDKRTWAANKDVIRAFLSVTSQAKLQQKRLTDERKYVEEKRSKNAESGRSSALKRKERHSTNVATNRQPKTNQPTPTPTILSEDKSSKSISNGLKPEIITQAFEEFWNEYPPTGGSRKYAREKYGSALRNGATPEAIRAGLAKYIAFLAATDGIPAHPSTWLNQERWAIDYDAALTAERDRDLIRRNNAGPRKKSQSDVNVDAWRDAIQRADESRRGELVRDGLVERDAHPQAQEILPPLPTGVR